MIPLDISDQRFYGGLFVIPFLRISPSLNFSPLKPILGLTFYLQAFQKSAVRVPSGDGGTLPAGSVITHYNTFIPVGCKVPWALPRGLGGFAPGNCGCLPRVVARSVQLRFRLRRKLRSLPCSSFSTRNRFAGLRVGFRDNRDDCDNLRGIPPSLFLVVTVVTVVTPPGLSA